MFLILKQDAMTTMVFSKTLETEAIAKYTELVLITDDCEP